MQVDQTDARALRIEAAAAIIGQGVYHIAYGTGYITELDMINPVDQVYVTFYQSTSFGNKFWFRADELKRIMPTGGTR